MTQRRLPPQASVINAQSDGRLVAPAATRNTPHIVEVLRAHAPTRGCALELASGTGQHIVAFAKAMADLDWQPSEVDKSRRHSIDLYCQDAGLPNLRPVIALDATAPGWGAEQRGRDLIVLINLLHLISAPEAQTLITESAAALTPGGLLAIYGPFKRNGDLVSDGDRQFHAALIGQDPLIGYKDIWDVSEVMINSGLTPDLPAEMPANNLMLFGHKG